MQCNETNSFRLMKLKLPRRTSTTIGTGCFVEIPSCNVGHDPANMTSQKMCKNLKFTPDEEAKSDVSQCLTTENTVFPGRDHYLETSAFMQSTPPPLQHLKNSLCLQAEHFIRSDNSSCENDEDNRVDHELHRISPKRSAELADRATNPKTVSTHPFVSPSTTDEDSNSSHKKCSFKSSVINELLKGNSCLLKKEECFQCSFCHRTFSYLCHMKVHERVSKCMKAEFCVGLCE